MAIDKTRASRDGHQFHEAWLARQALALVLSSNELHAIAVEGLAVDDEERSSDAAVEIADATFYYGIGASFEACTRMEVAQFKYSIAAGEKPFRVSDARKTLKKFAAAEVDFVAKYGHGPTSAKLCYSLNTNRPIALDMVEALRAAAAGETPASTASQTQLEQLRDATGLTGDPLRGFAARVRLVGRMERLRETERGNARTIADWSASDDILARARLGDLRQMVRDKAGFAGQDNKLIKQVDVLAALGLAHESDLLPTPQAFPDIGQPIKRPQVAEFAALLPTAQRWIVHAAGGIGKTVFVQSLATHLALEDEVVLFDCFGGGAYRTLTDGRHRPERGLLHVVNELACRGLCDPVLPHSNDAAEVVRRSLHRFQQAISAMRRTRPGRRLILIIDAADNAGLEADRRRQPAFPRELLEALSVQGSADGLFVIATARSERQDKAIGTAQCRSFPLPPFTLAETEAYISARRADATAVQMQVVHSRANGNPRVIANLIEPDRNLVGVAQTEAQVDLNDLIQARIDRAVQLADQKGGTANAIGGLLCALSMLPPPVPIAEIATAFGISAAEVESLAADLSPLLDRTRHGIIFRDEPTETLVEQRYGSQLHLLNDVVERLVAAQSSSAYAAQALPGLLFAMGRIEDLRALAFDARFPASLTSDVAKRAIRLRRLRMALGAAAQGLHYDAMVDLLVELSSVAAADDRGEDYLLSNPDLVVGLGDSEALRRLFEAKTGWPGTRHSRLATAYATDGDLAEAYTHAKRADEWHEWLWQRGEKDHPRTQLDVEDFVGIAVYLLARGKTTPAARYLTRWQGAYSYENTCRVLEVCKFSHALGKFASLPDAIARAVRCPKPPPAIAAAMLTAFPGLSTSATGRVLRGMTKCLKSNAGSEEHFPKYGESDSYSLGLLRCAMRAAHLGLRTEATAISEAAAPKRYGLWALQDPYSSRYILPWLLFVTVRSAAEGKQLTLFDCLPSELWQLVSAEPEPDSNEAQRALLDAKLKDKPADPNSKSGDAHEPKLSESDRQLARDRLGSRIMPLHTLAGHLAAILTAHDAERLDASLVVFFDGWTTALAAGEKSYYYTGDTARFLDDLYSTCAFHTLTAINAFKPVAGEALIQWMQRSTALSTSLCTALVAYFSTDAQTGALAGRMAALVLKAIESGDDVSQRSESMARLARALLPANRAEATALFSRGLSELEAIGSGDHAFTNELLNFARSLAVEPLRSEAAHRLAKICELNAYDSRKFPWPLAAAAFSRVWGLPYLAQISRWHDRGKAELELTLPCALTSLIRDRLMHPRDAICLLRLVEPVESWGWGWDDLLRSLMEAAPDDSTALLEEALVQFELSHPSRPPAWYVERIRKAAEEKAAAMTAVRATLERLEARASQPRQVKRDNTNRSSGLIDRETLRKAAEESEEEFVAAVDRADPLSASSIEALIAEIDKIDRALDTKSRAFKRLRATVSYADQSRHIEAVVSARNTELFTKNRILEDIRTDWLATSPSGLATLRDAGVKLVREHASELVSKEWGFDWEINELLKITGQSRCDLAVELIKAATSRELDTAATTWLNCASMLSSRSDRTVPKTALERLMDSGAARLVDDVGDGPWQEGLAPKGNSTVIAANLIWFCLGSAQAANRWRAAHAVRTLAKFSRWQVIDALFDCFDRTGAGAFQDPQLAFFVMHARQWFLLAVARIAIDHPTEIARHTARLEAIAFDGGFPHVALREASRRALLTCLSMDASEAAEAKRKRLSEVHVSAFPTIEGPAEGSSNPSWSRPKAEPEPEPPFHFDYDYDKYDLTKVATLFGLPKWRVADQCVTWIRTWDRNITHMFDLGGRDHPGGYSRHSRGMDDNYQCCGAYLARHALALVSGQLLATTPISETRYSYYTWDGWLAGFSPTREDGLWLSDGTDRYPDFSLHDLKSDDAKVERPADGPALLASLAGIANDGSIGAFFTVDGSWPSPDGVRVVVSSALVPTCDTDLAARALGTAPPFHMWLPSFEHDEDEVHRERAREMRPLEPWIADTDAELQIDEYDPYGCREAVRRSRPAKSIIDRFGLQVNKPWPDAWRDRSGGIAFRSAAWGQRKGQGEHETTEGGSALLCERSFLAELLSALDRDLLVLIKLEHFRSRSRYADDNESESSFTHSYTVLSVTRLLTVMRHTQAAVDMQAVKGLDESAQCEFRERLRALKH